MAAWAHPHQWLGKVICINMSHVSSSPTEATPWFIPPIANSPRQILSHLHMGLRIEPTSLAGVWRDVPLVPWKGRLHTLSTRSSQRTRPDAICSPVLSSTIYFPQTCGPRTCYPLVTRSTPSTRTNISPEASDCPLLCPKVAAGSTQRNDCLKQAYCQKGDPTFHPAADLGWRTWGVLLVVIRDQLLMQKRDFPLSDPVAGSSPERMSPVRDRHIR